VHAAVAIYRDTADRHREGMSLYILGLVMQGVGRFEEAITNAKAGRCCSP
jgi:hypothetical protein